MRMRLARQVRQTVLPLLAAMIWGTAFVAQSVGAESVGPFAFTAARSVIAFVFLLVLCLGRRALVGDAVPPPVRRVWLCASKGVVHIIAMQSISTTQVIFFIIVKCLRFGVATKIANMLPNREFFCNFTSNKKK